MLIYADVTPSACREYLAPSCALLPPMMSLLLWFFFTSPRPRYGMSCARGHDMRGAACYEELPMPRARGVILMSGARQYHFFRAVQIFALFITCMMPSEALLDTFYLPPLLSYTSPFAFARHSPLLPLFAYSSIRFMLISSPSTLTLRLTTPRVISSDAISLPPRPRRPSCRPPVH